MKAKPWSSVVFWVISSLTLLLGIMFSQRSISASTNAYVRAGWTADLSTLAHGVDGIAEIIDERTIVLRDFDYDGGGPAVYAYLGTENTNSAFENGLSMMPLLTRPGQPYQNDTITVTLPITGPNLDGFVAISIWCYDFKVNFGSGSFVAPAGASTPTATSTPSATSTSTGTMTPMTPTPTATATPVQTEIPVGNRKLFLPAVNR